MVKCTVEKDKIEKIIKYHFEHNNEIFEARYIISKKPTVELLHNGSHLGFIDDLKIKHDYIVNTDTTPIKVTVWIEYNIYSTYIGKINGLGIEIDEKPVQNTLADPETHIKNGRSGFYVLFFILLLKCIITYYSNYKEYFSHIVSIISSMVYFIPLLFSFIVFIKYFKWTKFALFTGLIISILEMVDYLYALPNSIIKGTNGATLLIWILLRIATICIFIGALKWKVKFGYNKNE